MTEDQKNRVFETGPDGETSVRENADKEGSAGDKTVDPMSFSTHILSLNMTALMHLGLVEGLLGNERDKEAARHIVDTLEMLERKTKGNLTSDEASLVRTIIHELKLKIVQAV